MPEQEESLPHQLLVNIWAFAECLTHNRIQFVAREHTPCDYNPKFTETCFMGQHMAGLGE